MSEWRALCLYLGGSEWQLLQTCITPGRYSQSTRTLAGGREPPSPPHPGKQPKALGCSWVLWWQQSLDFSSSIHHWPSPLPPPHTKIGSVEMSNWSVMGSCKPGKWSCPTIPPLSPLNGFGKKKIKTAVTHLVPHTTHSTENKNGMRTFFKIDFLKLCTCIAGN